MSGRQLYWLEVWSNQEVPEVCIIRKEKRNKKNDTVRELIIIVVIVRSDIKNVCKCMRMIVKVLLKLINEFQRTHYPVCVMQGVHFYCIMMG